MSWFESAMSHAREAFRAEHLKQPNLSVEGIVKLVSRNHYPFGERAMHPYKQWLKAMKWLRVNGARLIELDKRTALGR